MREEEGRVRLCEGGGGERVVEGRREGGCVMAIVKRMVRE